MEELSRELSLLRAPPVARPRPRWGAAAPPARAWSAGSGGASVVSSGGSSASASAAAAGVQLAPSQSNWREQRRANYLFGPASRPVSRASSAGSRSSGSASLSAHSHASRELQAAYGGGGGGGDAGDARARLARSPLAQPLRRPAAAVVGDAGRRGAVPPAPAPPRARPAAASRLGDRLQAASAAAAAAGTARRRTAVVAPPPITALPAPALKAAAAAAAASFEPVPASPPPLSPGSAARTADFSDIDARLESLYAFLRAARESSGALPSPAAPALALYAAAAAAGP